MINDHDTDYDTKGKATYFKGIACSTEILRIEGLCEKINPFL